MKDKLTINMISETETLLKGHGVHTAYLEMTHALRQLGHNVIVNEFGKVVPADITHLHTLGWQSYRKLTKGKGKKVISAHIVPDSFIGSLALARYWRPLAKRYLSLIYSKADLVLAVSHTVAKILNEELLIPASKIVVLYNSVNMSHYKTTIEDKRRARQVLGIGQDEFVVVGNGQVQPRKRLDVMCDAAEKIPDAKFIWVGGIPFKMLGAQYATMQKMLRHLPPNMHVTGVIELEDVKKYLQAADVFLLPSQQENHPMAILEAAGAGLPIVLRDLVEYNDTFKEDALRCNENNFLDTINRLRRDKEFYEKACQGSKRIAERFDSNTIASELVTIYRSLLSS